MSAHAAAPTRRLAASLAVVVSALALSACGGGSPTAPVAPAESNEPTVAPERESACRQSTAELRPRTVSGFCPPHDLGRRVE